MNRKYIFFISILLWATACSNTDKKAQETLNSAITLCETGNLSEAKLMIDSISILYPNAFETRKAGRKLMKEVQLKEYRRNLSYIDSLLPLRLKERDDVRQLFRLERNEKYQEKGEYVSRHEKNSNAMSNSRIRVRVGEDGKLKIESIFVGKQPLNHSSVRIERHDGMFAECDAVPFDGALNYRYKASGNHIEVIAYTDKKTLCVAGFIANESGNALRISYLGNRPYVVSLDNDSQKAFSDAYHLSTVMNEIKSLEKEKLIATKGIAVMNMRLTEEDKPKNK